MRAPWGYVAVALLCLAAGGAAGAGDGGKAAGESGGGGEGEGGGEGHGHGEEILLTKREYITSITEEAFEIYDWDDDGVVTPWPARTIILLV